MPYDFDTFIDRRGSGAVKWDQYKEPEMLHMWVADMDFPVAPPIPKAIKARLEHPFIGYTHPRAELLETICEYYQKQHGYTIEADWLRWGPGTIPALKSCILAFTKARESVLFCTPAYPPFFNSVDSLDRERINVPLKLGKQGWTFDFDAMQAALKPNTRMFILCNPHNPVGRVYTHAELEALAEFCLKNNLLVASDEIHCDVLYSGQKHIVFNKMHPELAERTAILSGPTKTYNLAGMPCCHVIIANSDLHEKFTEASKGAFVNCLGFETCMAAYTQCGAWKEEMLAYLDANRRTLYAFIEDRLPELKIWPMEATYMVWINIEGLRKLGVDDVYGYLIANGVRPLPGSDFGDDNYVRINFGCPRSVLNEGLKRIEAAVQKLRT